ncbi:hypothetical protein ACWET9_32165 [Streptomyces sp. NPDC004059]
MAFHLLLRPVAEHVDGTDRPATEETVEIFTEAFLRGCRASLTREGRPAEVASADRRRSRQPGRPKRTMAR